MENLDGKPRWKTSMGLPVAGNAVKDLFEAKASAIQARRASE